MSDSVRSVGSVVSPRSNPLLVINTDSTPQQTPRSLLPSSSSSPSSPQPPFSIRSILRNGKGISRHAQDTSSEVSPQASSSDFQSQVVSAIPLEELNPLSTACELGSPPAPAPRSARAPVLSERCSQAVVRVLGSYAFVASEIAFFCFGSFTTHFFRTRLIRRPHILPWI